MATKTTDWAIEGVPVRPAPYALAVVVPTFNEAGNVTRIVEKLDAALAGIAFEIVFVDDWSADGTADRIAAIAQTRGDVRVIRRFQRRGLSTAVIEGMMATMAPVVAVIDGDGQHDERLLPELFALIQSDRADIAIGSRYCAQGSTGEWGGRRVRASRLATRLSRLVLHAPVGDPMSGFFATRRALVERLLPELSGRGFKILFDLLSTNPAPLRVIERPYRFRCREEGKSKLGAGVAIDYVVMIVDRLLRRYLPSRLVMFGIVGTLGLGIHLVVLKAMLTVGGLSFTRAQTCAVIVAIAFNFLMNNSFTYRDRKLRGRRLVSGLLTFYAVCGAGALANIGAGAVVFAAHHRWWASGAAGAIVGSAWNFLASAMVTWRRR